MKKGSVPFKWILGSANTTITQGFCTFHVSVAIQFWYDEQTGTISSPSAGAVTVVKVCSNLSRETEVDEIEFDGNDHITKISFKSVETTDFDNALSNTIVLTNIKIDLNNDIDMQK